MGKSTTVGGGEAGVSIKGQRMLDKSLGNIPHGYFHSALRSSDRSLGFCTCLPTPTSNQFSVANPTKKSLSRKILVRRAHVLPDIHEVPPSI